MADKKITALTESTSLSTDDLFHVVDSPASSPSNKKITATNTFNKIPTYIGMNSIDALVNGTPVVSLTTAITTLNATGSLAATLAASTVVGQLKIIVCIGYSAPTTVAVDTTIGAGTLYTFSAVGESLTLMNTGAGWVPIAFGGNALATDPASGATAASPGAIAIT